jgi:hypothetical protein
LIIRQREKAIDFLIYLILDLLQTIGRAGDRL